MIDKTPKYKLVKTPYKGRQLAISDIHGHLNVFIALLEKIKFTKSDQLFLLGDYIDRGKESAGVIDYIIELQKKGYEVYPLLGNHEEAAINSHYALRLDMSLFPFSHLSKKHALVTGDGLLKKKYLNFFEELPYYFKLNNFLLSHAGFNFENKNIFEDYDSMLYIKADKYDKQKAGNRTVIHGHNVTKLSKIKSSINNKNKTICIDNGCYKQASNNYGNLCCLDLTNWELYTQINFNRL